MPKANSPLLSHRWTNVDLEGADVLLSDNEGRTLIADKAYDALQRVVAPAPQAGKIVVIPAIRDGRRQRNLIDHCTDCVTTSKSSSHD
jgi:hypothetical protein